MGFTLMLYFYCLSVLKSWRRLRCGRSWRQIVASCHDVRRGMTNIVRRNGHVTARKRPQVSSIKVLVLLRLFDSISLLGSLTASCTQLHLPFDIKRILSFHMKRNSHESEIEHAPQSESVSDVASV